MRMIGLVFVIALGTAPSGVLADAPAMGHQRFTRCCVELNVPELPAGPVCAEVRGARRLRPKRACRLLGGRPIGRGDCSLAACQAPVGTP